METVNFNCSFCGKLMAVGTNLLGRNVRCPHCKKVLQAPASKGPVLPPVAPPPKEKAFDQPTISSPPLESPESIFGEVHDDDLFGTRAPKVSMPAQKTETAPVPSRQTTNPVAPSHASVPPREPAPVDQQAATAAFEPVGEFPELGNPWGDAPLTAEDATHETPSKPGPFGESNREPTKARPSSSKLEPVQEGGGGGPLVWILLLYSALATGGIAYLFFTKTEGAGSNNTQSQGGDSTGQHPYAAIPDMFGQFPPADRKKLVKFNGMPPADLDVPEKLQVPLGETKRVGNLEITPLRVLSRHVTRFSKEVGRNDVTQRMTPGEVLLLYVKLKNVSDDVTFCPTDPAFNARFPRGTPFKPYTGFIIGKSGGSYLGGPFQWPDLQYERQYINGQENDDKPLAPQEEREYVIASVLEGLDIMKDLELMKPEEKAIWRVQLRRGLYPWKDKEGHEHETSADCVIGVPVAFSDVK